MSLMKIVNFQRNCLSLNSRCSNLRLFEDINKVISLSYSDMDEDPLKPPENLHGMKVLNKDAFNKKIAVLAVEAEDKKLTRVQKCFKKYILKICKMKCMQVTDKDNIKRLLLNPNLVKKKTDFDASAQKLFDELDLNADNFVNVSLDISYDNWSVSNTLKAVLPEDEPPLTSFSVIGHIIHVNIKPHLLEYKNIIGEILLDKTPNIRTVVNKSKKIDNTYRNFEMELICGVPDYIVSVKENGCNFKFDFSKVYWNPRLGTEHARVIDSLEFKDILFDVFCGVGPFSLPAAKKHCTVYANDLNSESVKWLLENMKLNKVSNDYLHVFNKDASDFICNDVKINLLNLWKNELFNKKIYIVMNLPVLALEFLKNFKGLIKSCEIDIEIVKANLPIVYCYFFVINSEDPNHVKSIVMQRSDINLNKADYSVHFVRNVASGMDMLKLELKLPLEYLISDSHDNENSRESCEEPKSKKICRSD